MPSSADLELPAGKVKAGASPGRDDASSIVRSGKLRGNLRRAGLIGTALIPFQGPKRLAYRLVFGYEIARTARIGLAYLDCKNLRVGENTRIAHGAVFLHCGDVAIGQNVLIGPANLFRGGELLELEDYSQVMRLNVINAIPDNDCVNAPDSRFKLGYGSVITAEHRIDFTDKVTIGRCSTFGGRNSSIWTHNRRSGLPVTIGDYCYIGSEIRMAPGTTVPDCSIVGIGSVLAKPISESWSLIAGVPAKRRRAIKNEDAELLFGKTRPDLPDQEYPIIPIQPRSEG